MKTTALLSILILLMCGFAFAQSSLAEFDKVRQIRLLQDNRENVRRLLADYKSDFSEDGEDDYSDEFSTENAEIEVFYSEGNCSGDDEFWNVKKWTASSIKVTPKNELKIKGISFNISIFTKERVYEDRPKTYIYHNKYEGIAFEVNGSKVNWINYFPSKNTSFTLCDNDEAKKFYSKESWFGDSKLEDRAYEIYCGPANVTNLFLETTEIFANCEDSEKRINCSVWNKEVSVKTIVADPSDLLSYQYTVSGGKIVGQGAKVVWDLSGLQPGNYTVTAAVDDGCGFCGMTKTKAIVVK
jgi:uncharacterized protein YkuJ